VWGDYDNDGDLDLYLVNANSANVLVRNDGGGTFVDVTSSPLGDTGDGRGVAWGDYDRDGDIDLYLANANSANKLFRNDGGGVFTDATTSPLDDAGNSTGVAWGDYDNDGDLDLYLANHGQANKLFRNIGAGYFVDATSGLLGDTGKGRGVAWGDYDNDEDLDLFLANSETANKLFRNDGGGVFTDVASTQVADQWGDGRTPVWADWDNDGDLDLYVSNATSAYANRYFENDGAGGLFDATIMPIGDKRTSEAVACADYDNDGDLDIYIQNAGAGNRLYRNDLPAGNNWLHVDLVGTVSNKSGIGARVRVVAGGLSQIREVSGGSGYMSQGSLTVEFGFGGSTSTVDTVQVLWPSGIVQDSLNVATDQTISITEQGTPTAIGDQPRVPQHYALYQNVPNPFNPTTVIRYGVPSGGAAVTLTIYDVRGGLVRTLVNGVQTSGEKQVRWDGKDEQGQSVATGVYFYRLSAPGFVETRKMMLLK
jgi:hypothetical protein